MGAMGTRTMSHLNGLLANDLEIVGFNAHRWWNVVVHAGRATQIRLDALRAQVGGNQRGGVSWHDAEEVDEFAKARRWTRLREPLSLPGSCLSDEKKQLTRQPMVIFTAQSFLDVAGLVAWPASFDGETFLWRCLDQVDQSVRAACGSAIIVETLLNNWAMALKHRFDAMRRNSHDPASLKRVADFMLCAARDRPTRWQAYLRYAMVQEPEQWCVRPSIPLRVMSSPTRLG